MDFLWKVVEIFLSLKIAGMVFSGIVGVITFIFAIIVIIKIFREG